MTPDGWKKCFQYQKTNTPEWSIEPYGSRTLCNACGLYYKCLIHILKNHFLSRSSLIFVIQLETILSILTNLSSFIVEGNNSSNVVHLMIKNFNLIKKKYLFQEMGCLETSNLLPFFSQCCFFFMAFSSKEHNDSLDNLKQSNIYHQKVKERIKSRLLLGQGSKPSFQMIQISHCC